MKKIWIFLVLIFFIILTPSVYAITSDYVLPYPSAMPGSKTYKLHVLWDKLMEYWYFGNFAQFEYNLKQSDKYLVEAKTLFEYKQYLLAFQALKKSDDYFKKIPEYLEKARLENKNITQKQNILKNASLKHVEVLNSLKLTIPDEYVWTPEKSSSTKLNIKDAIENSIRTRKISL